jgi:putative redox protein
MKTTTTWKHGEVFEAEMEGIRVPLDGNRKEGFSPKWILLSSLAACSGIDIVDILTKMRVTFSDLVIDTEAGQTEEHPRVFQDITITYRITTAEENREKINKAIMLSLDKYCGVAAMLRKNSNINYELDIRTTLKP